MKKNITFGLILLLFTVILLGCQSQNNNDNSKQLELHGEIKGVNIYKANEFDTANLELIVSFNEEGNLKTLKNIINSATRQEGIVAITEPDYDLEIIYEDNNKEQLYLWLLEGGLGSLMKVEDMHTIYNFPEEMNDEFMDLIELNQNTKIEVEKSLNESSVDNVTLYVSGENDGMYQEMIVRTKDKIVTFPWINVANPTYAPTLNVADVNDDGKDEVIIILTTDYGTGIWKQEIHVLNLEDLTEINVENPIQSVNKKITSNITKRDNKIDIVINWDGNILNKSYNESDSSIWFEEVAFDSIINYEVIGNKITTTVFGSATPSKFVIKVIVEYGLDFKVENIIVKEVEE